LAATSVPKWVPIDKPAPEKVFKLAVAPGNSPDAVAVAQNTAGVVAVAHRSALQEAAQAVLTAVSGSERKIRRRSVKDDHGLERQAFGAGYANDLDRPN
jgi:hypothetical protein